MGVYLLVQPDIAGGGGGKTHTHIGYCWRKAGQAEGQFQVSKKTPGSL